MIKKTIKNLHVYILTILRIELTKEFGAIRQSYTYM